jgi:ketosteroid isomerase-like protein
MQSPVDVVRTILEARRAGNFIALHAHCSEAITFTFNADPDKVGAGTTHVGWSAVSAHFARVERHWEHVERTILSITAAHDQPNKVIVQFFFRARHRASGEILEAKKRQEWHVRNGIATRMDEILDAASIHAFQRLADTRIPATENAPHT